MCARSIVVWARRAAAAVLRVDRRNDRPRLRRRPPAGAVTIFTKNIHIPGLKSCEYNFLSPESKTALNERKTARWHAILLEGEFRKATQLAKDHTHYCRTTLNTVRLVISDAAALTKLIKHLSEFQKKPILRKLLHHAGRPMSFAIDPKSTAKPVQSKSKSTPRSSYVQRNTRGIKVRGASVPPEDFILYAFLHAQCSQKLELFVEHQPAATPRRDSTRTNRRDSASKAATIRLGAQLLQHAPPHSHGGHKYARQLSGLFPYMSARCCLRGA